MSEDQPDKQHATRWVTRVNPQIGAATLTLYRTQGLSDEIVGYLILTPEEVYALGDRLLKDYDKLEGI